MDYKLNPYGLVHQEIPINAHGPRQSHYENNGWQYSGSPHEPSP